MTGHTMPSNGHGQRLDDYKQRIAALYEARASVYDSTSGNADWHRRIAHQLVRRALLKPGQRVLDIATGTGLVALEAAMQVGPEGLVLGIDITPGMLAQASSKMHALGIGHVQFELADAEHLDLPESSFDHVLCCAALVWMRDVCAVLTRWRTLLAPGGWIGLQTHVENAFITSRILQRLAAVEGIDLRFHREVGTPDRLYSLLVAAGFTEVDIVVEPDGHFISLEQALAWGPHADFPAPGQYPPPLRACTATQLARLRALYEEAIRSVSTPQGIWNDCTSIFARAQCV